jgi:hypothetical protein
VFTYDERCANIPQDSHKYEGQFQDFFFQATELLVASRRVQSIGSRIDRFPALDQIDSLKERKQRAIRNGRTDAMWCKFLCELDEHQTLYTHANSLWYFKQIRKNVVVYEPFAGDS